MTEQTNRPFRSRTDRIIFGVCGGLAKHYDLDATLIRILFVLLALSNGIGVVLYFILAIILPVEPGEGVSVDREEKIKEFAEGVGQKTKALADEMRGDQTWRSRSRNAFGAIVILIGVIMLLERVAPAAFRWLNWGLVWPLLIIFVGAYLIFHKD